jgi:hypothetical protein
MKKKTTFATGKAVISQEGSGSGDRRGDSNY